MPPVAQAQVVPQRPQDLQHGLRRLAWRTLALACVALGAAGAVLPGLPTVPFLLVAAWAGGRGWPALEAWLLAHPRYGPDIRRWREHGAVPRRAKWASSLMMVFSAGVIALSALPLVAKIGLPAFMACVAAWLWRRPER
jgi:uncharacterized membrane protein YbaN (DUF454 family)